MLASRIEVTAFCFSLDPIVSLLHSPSSPFLSAAYECKRMDFVVATVCLRAELLAPSRYRLNEVFPPAEVSSTASRASHVHQRPAWGLVCLSYLNAVILSKCPLPGPTGKQGSRRRLRRRRTYAKHCCIRRLRRAGHHYQPVPGAPAIHNTDVRFDSLDTEITFLLFSFGPYPSEVVFQGS